MRVEHRWAVILRWAARLLGTPLALLVFLDFLTDTISPSGFGSVNVFRLGWVEQVLLDVVLMASIGLVLGWTHELVGGWLALAGGLIFLVACLVAPGMRMVWGLGAALALPGLLYLLAAKEHAGHPASPARC